MIIIITKWVLTLVSIFNYGYMLVDGIRALTVGDYFRPKSGEYAGQLGPWNKLVNAIGINPESTAMKVIFIIFGLLGLMFLISLWIGKEWSVLGFMILSICTLWYLVPGTILSVIQIICLIMIYYKRG